MILIIQLFYWFDSHQGTLTERERPPRTNYFRSAAFVNANITYFLTKQATLKRSNVMSLLVRAFLKCGTCVDASTTRRTFWYDPLTVACVLPPS